MPETGYDAIKEEVRWREKGGGNGKPLPARLYFAHNHVRSRLGETLISLGGNNNSLVLDVGCGSGEDAVHIEGVTKKIIGVDISDKALRTFNDKDFRVVLADVKALPFRNNCFDFVVISGLLHHLVGQGNLAKFLSEFVRVARAGGYVIALEPNLFNCSGLLMNIFNTIKPGITGLVPHERALSPLSLARAFKTARLRNVKCISASYVWNRFPLFVSRFIARYEDRIRFRRPFNFFGWFTMVYGQKETEETSK